MKKAYIVAIKRIIHPLYEKGKLSGLFKPVDTVFATEMIVGMILTAVNYFPLALDPLVMFNDTLKMITDTIALIDRTRVDEFG